MRAESLIGSGKMACFSNRCLLALLVVWGVVGVMGLSEAQDLESLLHHAQTGGVYKPVTRAELERAEELFFKQLQGTLTDPTKEWMELKFNVVSIEGKGERILAIIEREESRQGRGFFVFRMMHGNKKTIALQMPHSFNDLNTGVIGARLFMESRFCAAAWNTVPRNTSGGGDADQAHMSDCYFTAFSRAFARYCTEGVLVQIHGFDKKKRKTGSGRKADLIVSSGTKTPSGYARDLEKCWDERNDISVMLYPGEVTELGGTLNSSGRALQGMDHHGFIHVEVSRRLRERLLTDCKERRLFLDCLEKIF